MMKKIETADKLSVKEIRDRLTKSQYDLIGLRVRVALKEEKDTSKVRKARKEIARLNTVLAKKEEVK